MRSACRPAQSEAQRSWWILLALGAALALAGCQDAYNANNGFNFNNPNDPTPTNTTGVYIAGISFLGNTAGDEYVIIVNGSGTTANMEGWKLVNTTTLTSPPTPSNSYTFTGTAGTTTGFNLGAGSLVRVHSSAAPPGGDTSTDVYGGPTWASGDVAELEQPGGGGVSSCTVGSPTC